MPAREIRAARTTSGNVPRIVSRAYKTGQTFKKGAVLIFDTGEVTEAGADPAGIAAVAAEGAGKRPGYDMANSSDILQVTGRKQEVSVFEANDDTVFSMSEAANTVPTVAHIGNSYGVAKNADGIWQLDVSETTAAIFTVVDIDVDQKIFFCKVKVGKQLLP